MFHARAYDNARPDGISVLEIVDEPPERDAPRRFVPLKRTVLNGEVTGPLAALRLTQVFGYSREQCGQVLEAVYRFPLPGDAAVTGVLVRFGTVEIRATLNERQRAETDYEEAKRQGRQAALLTRESPDVFTLQVAGIAPDQDVAVETEYVQLARAEGAGWSLRVPLTTSPRFVRGDEAGSRHAHGQPLAQLRDPGHRFALDLFVVGAAAVESPTHRLATTAEGEGVRLRLREGEVLPDRDCVLTWRPAQEAERPSLQVFLHEDAAASEVYFLALAAPPKTRPARPVSREAIVLVDHSGSMQGPKWEAADWAVKKFLSELGERDVFALGLFHDTASWIGKGVQPATADAIKKAIAFLEQHKDSGGTQLGVALEQALDRPRFGGEAARHVLLITDAEVSDEGRILRLAEEESRLPDRRRIDVLCIDAAPNSFLAHELAERGGGVCKFLTSEPEEIDIATALDEVLADWSQPVLTGLRLEVNRLAVQASGRIVLAGDAAPGIDLGDLPAGRPVWVAGRVPRGQDHLTFRLRDAAGRVVADAQADLAPERNARPALKALFGARRVLGLEFLIHAGRAVDELGEQLTRLGYDPAEVLGERAAGRSKVYAENERADVDKALRRLLVREALSYGLASAETSFVAVRTEAGQPVAGTVVVANALPSGWSPEFSAAACYSMAGSVDVDRLAEFCDDMESTPAPAASLGGLAFSVRIAAPRAKGTMARGFVGGSVAATPAASPGKAVLFSGVPTFEQRTALLFDSQRASDAGRLPAGEMTLVRLQVTFPKTAPPAGVLGADLWLLLFVDDLAAPRARVRLADLLSQGGERPLNVMRRGGQIVRLVLEGDPPKGPIPALEVSLSWN